MGTKFAKMCMAIASLSTAACDSSPSARDEIPVDASDTAGHMAHWGYEAHNGPTVWADLDTDYAVCRDGREQSPIDIRDPQPADLTELSPEYLPASMRIIRHEHVVDIIDNGHTIQVNYDEGSVLRLADKTYGLAQYHFHAPSEHTINGRHSPMEMHLVHQSASGDLAVLGVFVDEGAHNGAFDAVWAELPDEVGDETHLEHVTVNVNDLLPDSRQTYRYAGSLTTPPCSEGVNWIIAVESITLSRAQIDAFTTIINGNNRPTQPLGERNIVTDLIVDE